MLVLMCAVRMGGNILDRRVTNTRGVGMVHREADVVCGRMRVEGEDVAEWLID